MKDKTKQLLQRLFNACQRIPDFGGDLWARGIYKIQEKYGVTVWLSSFFACEPEMVEYAEPHTSTPISYNHNRSVAQ